VENVYTLRIMNMEQNERTYRVRPNVELEMEYVGERIVRVAAGGQRSLPISLFAAEGTGEDPNFEISFTVETVDEPIHSVTEISRFLRPARPASSARRAGDGAS
jgi:hypothetical protein